MPAPSLQTAVMGARLRAGDPEAAREVIRAIEVTGSRKGAARTLGCGVATVYRWLRLPVVAAALESRGEG